MLIGFETRGCASSRLAGLMMKGLPLVARVKEGSPAVEGNPGERMPGLSLQ